VSDRKFLSSKQVAELLGVSLGSVVNWERQNKLFAHRTPGGHRRFSMAEVRRYCRLHGLPVSDELGPGVAPAPLPAPVVLVVHADRQYRPRLLRRLPARSHLDLRGCETALGLGFELGHSRPSLVVVDLVKPVVSWAGLVETCSRLCERPAILGLLDRDTPRPNPGEEHGPSPRVLLESPSDSEVIGTLYDLLLSVQSDSSGPWALVPT